MTKELIEFTFKSFKELYDKGFAPATNKDYILMETPLEIGIELCVDVFGLVWTTDTGRPKGKVEKL